MLATLANSLAIKISYRIDAAIPAQARMTKSRTWRELTGELARIEKYRQGRIQIALFLFDFMGRPAGDNAGKQFGYASQKWS